MRAAILSGGSRIVIGILLAVHGGCSWIAMTPPPDREPGVRPVACSTSAVAPTIDTLGAVGFAAIAVILGVSLPDAEEDAEELRPVVGMGAAIAFTYAMSARSGILWVKRCRGLNASPLPVRDDTAQPARRAKAWQATKVAAAAARDGDCERVRQLDAVVRALDGEFHATVFKRDVAIARCL